jgi:hypothetical protein
MHKELKEMFLPPRPLSATHPACAGPLAPSLVACIGGSGLSPGRPR